MANRSGLLELVRNVRAFLADRGIDAEVRVGWLERGRVDNQGVGRANRVVFTPSDDGGGGGRIVGIRGPGARYDVEGSSRRGLYNWERTVSVSVWAGDGTGREDEERQVEATEELFERVMQAVGVSAAASVEWGAVTWTVPNARPFGRELRAALTFKHPMFGEEYAVVNPSPAVSRAE